MNSEPTVSPDWYCTFFHGLALDFWRAVITPEMTASEIDFVLSRLPLAPGARVLDAPCGNGRHSLELARRGFRVTGIDISREFLDEAISASAASSLDIEFRHGDLTSLADLDGTKRFEGAVCLGNSFGYLSHADTLLWLRRLSDALVPGAGLVLDTGMVAEALLPSFEKELDLEYGGIRMHVEHGYDVMASRMVATYTFTQGERRESHAMSQGVYTCADLCRLLASVGFETTELSGVGATEGVRPFRLGDSWLRLVAVKR